tara:strand:+ start:4796 stop:5515 length:720 start_codon:yes stop_codon:yes gene_type:complete
MNISVDNISHSYKDADRLSIDQLSLKIKSGTKHGIFGSNGAGKSTLIKIICNVISPSSGTVVFNEKGNDLNDKVEVKQSIGYVPQDFAFYEELTLLQNAKYFGTMFNLTDIEIQEQYQYLVSIFGLKNDQKKKISSFSGGMKRKVNLILGLLHNPQILILDEPIVGIDVHSKNDILNYLNELHQLGKTIIYTSHQMNESQSFCENFTLLHEGRNIVTGNLEEVLQHQNKKNLEAILLDQ